MATVGETLLAATQALKPVTDTPRLDAEILMAHALGMTRAKLLGSLHTPYAPDSFEDLLQRRLDYEPIAYVLGEWEFYSLTLACRSPILVPRPETEHLVDVALESIGELPANVLDLCTGTGCVAIAIAMNAPQATVDATDTSDAAIQLAQENFDRHDLSDRVTLHQGDLFAAVPADLAYNVIVSNPPYVADTDWPDLPEVIKRHEDPAALLAGPDGLDVIRRIVAEAPAHLRPGGILAFEIGMGQDSAVESLLTQHGYSDVAFRADLAGIRRIAIGRRPLAGTTM